MTSGAVPLTQGGAWNALREHYEVIKAVQMRDLFAKDPGRGARLVCDAQGIYLDYSKNRLTDDTMVCSHLARRLLADPLDAMFRATANVTGIARSSTSRCALPPAPPLKSTVKTWSRGHA